MKIRGAGPGDSVQLTHEPAPPVTVNCSNRAYCTWIVFVAESSVPCTRTFLPSNFCT